MDSVVQGETRFLFVYGTLRQGFDLDWRRELGARFCGRGRVSGKLYDLGEYPGAIPLDINSPHEVAGELYELSDPQRAMEKLDEYEGFLPVQPERSLFVRKVAPVVLEDRTRRDAWVYFYNRQVDETRLIPGGDYGEKAAAGRAGQARR